MVIQIVEALLPVEEMKNKMMHDVDVPNIVFRR